QCQAWSPPDPVKRWKRLLPALLSLRLKDSEAPLHGRQLARHLGRIWRRRGSLSLLSCLSRRAPFGPRWYDRQVLKRRPRRLRRSHHLRVLEALGDRHLRQAFVQLVLLELALVKHLLFVIHARLPHRWPLPPARRRSRPILPDTRQRSRAS